MWGAATTSLGLRERTQGRNTFGGGLLNPRPRATLERGGGCGPHREVH